MADVKHTETERMRDHFLQLDHWTFFVGFVLVLINVFVRSRKLSLSAALLLAVALIYDLAEFLEAG